MSKELQIKEHHSDTMMLLFEEQFSISELDASIKKTELETDIVLEGTRNAVIKAFTTHEATSKYVVDMSDDLKDAIEQGDIELVTTKTGDILAQLRGENGKFGERLPIKKELEEQGISTEEVQMALQMETIRNQLQSIIEHLRDIEGRVQEVLQGQHNDRIGLFYSGLSLFTEAKTIRDISLRKQVTAQALKAISDANSQMIQEIRTSIDYLMNEKYKRVKKPTEDIQYHLNIIHQCYDVVYKASFLKALIYQENGEILSMLTSISEYGRFVEMLIVPYAGKLSELDRNDRYIEKGTWGRIANSLSGCRDLCARISSNNSYFLAVKEKNDGN